jgi:hypothetical protein
MNESPLGGIVDGMQCPADPVGYVVSYLLAEPLNKGFWHSLGELNPCFQIENLAS